MENKDGLDPVFAADRDNGVAPPETGESGSNVVGRPKDANEAGFAEPHEHDADEREKFTETQAVRDGGSFDGLGVPVADDSVP